MARAAPAARSSSALALRLPHLGRGLPCAGGGGRLRGHAVGRLLLLAMLALAALRGRARAHVRRRPQGAPRDGTTYRASTTRWPRSWTRASGPREPRAGGRRRCREPLSPADPAAPATVLVVFPEDVGLVAALIGAAAQRRARRPPRRRDRRLFARTPRSTTTTNAIADTARPAARPRPHRHALPRLLRDLRELAMTHGVPRRGVQRGRARRAGAATEPDLGRRSCATRTSRRARTPTKPCRPSLQHDARLRARRRGLVPDGNGGRS